MATLTSYALGTVTLIMLVSLGILFVPEKTYYCQSKDIVLECVKLSSGIGTRCYLDTGTYKTCSEGWKKVEQFLPKEEIKQVKVYANKGNYVCDTKSGVIESYTKCIKEDGKQAYLGELI